MAFLDESGLAELWERICETSGRIETGSYVGTGTFSAANVNKLTFKNPPVLVIIYPAAGGLLPNTAYWTNSAIWAKGQGIIYINSASKEVIVVVNNNEFMWYSLVSAANQLNTSGETYYWIALCAGETAAGVELIQFTVNTATYFAEAGMTWTDWVNSSYNTGNFVIKGEVVLDGEDGFEIYYEDDGTDIMVNPTDVIDADIHYDIYV